MEQNKQDIRLGRFLSLVLRHNPAAASITLDENGWANVQELLAGVTKTGRSIDMETLERIAAENNKQRYSFNDNHTKIRANQGHSVSVDVELQEDTPPPILYHGTADKYLKSILRDGLNPQKRLHVHLSMDVETAQRVGARHGEAVILAVDAAAMAADGHVFWRSANGVWLCPAVPPKYLSLME